MLKHGSDAVEEWMFFKCDCVWRQGDIPNEYRKQIFVPLHIGNSNKNECNKGK